MNPELADKIDEAGCALYRLEDSPSPFVRVICALKAQMLVNEIAALTSMEWGRSTAPGEKEKDE